VFDLASLCDKGAPGGREEVFWLTYCGTHGGGGKRTCAGNRDLRERKDGKISPDRGGEDHGCRVRGDVVYLGRNGPDSAASFMTKISSRSMVSEASSGKGIVGGNQGNIARGKGGGLGKVDGRRFRRGTSAIDVERRGTLHFLEDVS